MSEQAFTSDERAQLKRSAHLGPYADTTKDQLVGLLQAVANYVARIGPDGVPPWIARSEDTVLRAAHGRFIQLWRRIGDQQTGPDIDRKSVAGAAVFGTADREKLRLDKYLRNVRSIQYDELVGLLEEVAKYSDVAPYLDYLPTDGPREAPAVVGYNRCVHAHNALLEFRRTPFTREEFVDDLHKKVLSYDS